MTSSDSSLRADVQLRIKGKIEKSVPDDAERRAALDLLAYAIENADDERDNAWYLRETWQGLSLFAGRLQACLIGRGKIEMSVMGPIMSTIT